MKHVAALVVAVLVVIPSLSRAQRKLDHRSDLKPTASFRDVDRPPEVSLEPANHESAADALAPALEPTTAVELIDQPHPNTPLRSRADTLRAPPPFV